MQRLAVAAPAKLNLHLGVHSELDVRHYHRVDSLMVALDIADEVVVEECARDEGLRVVCVPPVGIEQERNTAYRAASLLGKELGRQPNVCITIYKCVPDQAGLGGSSSDAAAVLRALCALWDVDVQSEAVAAVARRVGADVPFFLDPVPTLLVGAGDTVAEKFATFAKPLSVALVRPTGPGVSTPLAYAAFDEAPTSPADPEPLCAELRSGIASACQVAGLLANNLDPVACRLLPQVSEIRRWLLSQKDVLGGQVSGSGSCVFAVCANDAVAERVVADARNAFTCWAQTAHIS